MASRNYERLQVVEFGKQLILSQDLDPIYSALRATKWDPERTMRWLLAYWCWYSAATACYCAEAPDDKDYWVRMLRVAKNEEPTPFGGRWERGKERRHARGTAGVKMVEHLKGRFGDPSPLLRVADMTIAPFEKPEIGSKFMKGEDNTCASLMKRVKSYYLFGDWIAFKVADMAERVLGIPISFKNAEVFMFKDPVEAALMVWRLHGNQHESAKPKDRSVAISKVVTWLRSEFAGLEAPPLGAQRKREVDLQEIETVLCKWKSHVNGHYPLFNDIDEINEGLLPWQEHCGLAEEFLAAMPRKEAS